jgi:hypothetical protein
MGFFYIGVREALSSEHFKRFYMELRKECPRLLPFPDHNNLIRFFHDKTQDMDQKDAILFDLIAIYRRPGANDALTPFFIVLFTPFLSWMCDHGGRKCPGIEKEHLIQEIVIALIQVLRDEEIKPFKVAGQVIGKVKNRLRSYLNQQLKADPLPGMVTELTDHAQDETADDAPDISDAETFLDHLVAAGVMTAADRAMIASTTISGIPLKKMFSGSGDYERIKKKRQRIFAAIRQYCLKASE